MKLLNRIRKDWQVWAQEREVNVIHEYARRGEKIIMIYAG